LGDGSNGSNESSERKKAARVADRDALAVREKCVKATDASVRTRERAYYAL
jgi:hypothetical protein